MADSNPTASFFNQLKLVCRGIENGIAQLQKEVETKKSSRSAGNAVLKLKSLEQDIRQMKMEGREKCQSLDADGVKFNELLTCCRSLIDIQNNKLHNIEMFMKQYGYKDYKPAVLVTENNNEKNGGNQDVEEKTEEDEKLTTPPPQEKPNRSRTPKPEDFGFSKYTLKAMERGFNNLIQQDFPSRFQNQPSSEAMIPSVFNQNEFVSLTPSVFGRHVPFHTPGKYQEASPTFCDFLTPAEYKPSNPEQKYGSDLPKLNFPSESPEPPVFNTPGVKHLGKKEPEIASSLFKNNLQQSVMASPQVPDFRSESARKLMGIGNEVPKEPCVKSSRARLYDEMPQTPELTCNIRTLRELSGISNTALFKQDIQKENREPTPPTFPSKDMGDIIVTMPKEFQPLTDHNDVTSNITPTMPEMLTERVSKFKSGVPQARDLTKTPPTPKFMSQYATDLVQKNKL